MVWNRVVVCGLVTLFGGVVNVDAQWLSHPAVGIPRDAEGKPALSAPAPQLPDRKPDLTGLWRIDIEPAYVVNIAADLDPAAVTPTASKLFDERIRDFGKDDPWTACLPMGGPRRMARGGFVKMIHTPTLLAMLYEDLTYRQVHLDGRTLPQDPGPSFMGYSVGHWEGDTLVVESTGFNDRRWLDFGGNPHTERLKTVERFSRVSLGRMDVQVKMVDDELYRQPITFSAVMNLSPDTELLEYVCAENPVSRLSGRTEEQKRVVVPPDILATYVGTYEVVERVAAFGISRLTVFLSNGELFVDLNGKGRLPMVPLSETMFSPRLLGTYEFIKDANGKVTHVFADETEGRHRFNRVP